MSAVLERIPLPTLRNFTLFSCLSISTSMLFAWSNAKYYMMEALNSTANITEVEKDLVFNNLSYSEYGHCLIVAMTSQLWTIWTVINMCCCLMLLVCKGIQLAVFGALRVSEEQQLREKFWNFAFYKFIFIFGVLNVQYMNDGLMWIGWFGFLCSLQMLTQLCKYRFEYLSCSPATPKLQHMKLIFLLIFIMLISFCLVAASIFAAIYTDLNIFGFMVAECFLLIIATVYVLMKYTIYLVDINHDGLWETRGSLAYYTELICELSSLFIEFTHYLHVQIWSNVYFSMASFVIFIQIRHLFNEIQKRITRHRNYLNVVKSMEARFAEATDDEITEYDDNCAICWDKMQKARKLPCGHFFHNPCLRSWLAQDISCPTCRVSLSEQKPDDESVAPPVGADDDDGAAAQRLVAGLPHPGDLPLMNRTNHLFHFDASRYISWLPRFSVAVTHLNEAHGHQPTQLDAMANEVRRMFPTISLRSIIQDLRTTHSVEITIDNILEGNFNMTNSADEDSASDADSEDADPYNVFERPRPVAHNEHQQSPATRSTEEHLENSEIPSTSGNSDNMGFLNDPETRQALLHERKSELLARARKQYNEETRNNDETLDLAADSSSTQDDLEEKKTN